MPHDDDLNRRISAAIEAWKVKLLDLTKRNRLLNFKVNKVSTVEVVDEVPAQIFRNLYLEERSMRFRARKDAGIFDVSDNVEIDNGSLWDQEDLFEGGESSSVQLYDEAQLEERHRDDWLQTALAPEKLDHSLRRIADQSRLTLEEQGVHTLFLTLGMLHYTEAQNSETDFRAPLLLLPVELSRKNARSGYLLTVGDEEPLINPAIAEYARNAGVTLPAFPDASTISDSYDLNTLFLDTAEVVKDKKGWRVSSDIYLCLLSFQKFVMFKDLEANSRSITAHPLIRQLIGRTGNNISGLPKEIRELNLDQFFPPESTFQVVDADSSQLRAMAAVDARHDLVIEGPPGTGKSQTITNLIAQTLAAGRTVLFVAEKMAALSVVHQRLKDAKLDEFCLELHSSKANKRLVMQDLARTLEASVQSAGRTVTSDERLPELRETLGAYVNALHEPFGALGKTPYQGFGELGRVRDIQLLNLQTALDGVTAADLQAALRQLDDVSRAVASLGMSVADHPWRDTTKTYYTEIDLKDIADVAAEVIAALEEVIGLGTSAAKQCGLPAIVSAKELAVAIEVAGILKRSPGAPLSVLQNDAWNTPPAAATELLGKGRTFTLTNARLNQWFSPSVLEQAHVDDIAYVQQKRSGFLGTLAVLDSRYRAITHRWKGYRKPSYKKSVLQQADDLKSADRIQALRKEFTRREGEARQLFGNLWQGERSDWATLQYYIEWVVEYRKECLRHGLDDETARVATQPRPKMDSAAELVHAHEKYSAKLKELSELVGWPQAYLADAPFLDAGSRLTHLLSNVNSGPSWGAFERLRSETATSISAEVLTAAMKGAVGFEQLSAVFERAFYTKWLASVVRARPELERFQGITHEERIREFRQLDRSALQHNRTNLVDRLRHQAQERLRGEAARRGVGFLQREIVKQRAIAPLRKTMANARETVRAIKPCFLMSPLTVAQLLDGSTPSFDLVIFDEASQLPPEDAVGAVIRGSQLVVVGDPKQLPPTNFFAVNSGQVQPEVDEDGNPIYDDAESVLEQFMGAGVPMSRLKWHYRSAHESLITFSNVSFYDADLYTFPCTDHPCSGLQFVHVANGRYEGAGLNVVEARRVVVDVVAFAKEQLARPQHERLSLGVGTFNLRQQLAIQDELERFRREDPSVEEFFSLSNSEPFFVKNLENIQGDERDAIFLSVTYGPGTDGRIRYNFGPLNGENGWRRLNVLVTRARRHMRVFSSMRGEDINPVNVTSRGPQLLREFLIYAQHGRIESVLVDALADAESPFEREVLKELVARNYRVVPQVGSAGYRIDIGILDTEIEGRFVCGIECDGVAYHSAETARDRDRLREQVLRDRGWSIHRVWSTDWFRDRPNQIARLVELIERDRERIRSGPLPRSAEPVPEAEAAPPVVTALHAIVDEMYRRPEPPPYELAGGAGQFAGKDFLSASRKQVAQALRYVVQIESPVHKMDAFTRVAGFWNVRLGSRIQRRLETVVIDAESDGLLRRSGEFLWSDGQEVRLRSRAGMRVPAHRIPLEEIELAVRLILEAGHSLPMDALVTEVRAVLGFSRTGEQLEARIATAIESLLKVGVLGQGAMGIRTRDR